MKTEMPPTALSQKPVSESWEMSEDPLLLSRDSCSSRYGCCESPPMSCSPQSQPDSGLQSSECLSENEDEKTLTKQTAVDEHRLPRAVKTERLGQKTPPAPYHKTSRPSSPKASGAKQGSLEQLEKIAGPASEAERWLATLVSSILRALSVEKFEDFQCVSEAKGLLEVTKLMVEGHQLHHFLRVFGHSASCNNKTCMKPCLMFRRIRGHLVTLDHECAIVHVYSQLTRMHVDTCVTEKCGFPTCKGLQAYRAREMKEVLPRNFYLLERDNAVALGKLASVKKEAEKDDKKCGDPQAAKEQEARKLTVQTAVKKEVVDETSEALDLSDRVSKLEMGSPKSRIIASA